MRYYIFNSLLHASKSATVIFDYLHSFDPEEIRNELVLFNKIQPRTSIVFYVCPELPDRQISNMMNELADILNMDEAEIFIYTYGPSGFNDENKNAIDKLKKSGLLNIVCNRNALIYSGTNFHYELPSKKHSPYLIRTANILSHNEEIYFIALCVLDEIKSKNYRHISCDSSSIMHIAFGLKQIKSIFGEKWEIPIDSFYSYHFIENEYAFKPNSLVLISASNSGNLEDRILEGLENDFDILTILMNCKNIERSNFLINLADYDSTVFSGVEKELYDSTDCKYCQDNSISVKVHSEQFLPSKVVTRQVVLRTSHKPKWLDKTVDGIGIKSALSCFKSEDLAKKRREVFLEVDQLFSDSNSFRCEFEKYLKNHMPANPDLIIFLQDASSKKLANEIWNYYSSISKEQIKRPIVVGELNGALMEEHLVILVVCGCITTGNQFNSVSRELRKFKNSSLHYFTIFSRLPSDEKFKILKNNLEFRSENKNNCVNKFHSLYKGFIPDNHSKQRLKHNKAPWENELEFWMKLENPPKFVVERIQLLGSNEGLVDNLFLANPFNNQNLQLRPNFAFYKFKKGHTPSQSIVYFIVLSILHSARNPSVSSSGQDDAEFIINHEHSHSLLSLDCFNRFNDGVIQASILRAALPIELDYASSSELSTAALKTFKDLFKNPELTVDNEGILEFLYAISIGKLQLRKKDGQELVEYLEEKYQTNNDIAYLLNLIKNLYSK